MALFNAWHEFSKYIYYVRNNGWALHGPRAMDYPGQMCSISFHSRGIMAAHEQLVYDSALLLQEVETSSDKEAVICSFIQKQDISFVPVCPFPEDAEFLNCSAPLSFDSNLKGKILVLDFFTYCCINCMHVIPGRLTDLSRYCVKNDIVKLL